MLWYCHCGKKATVLWIFVRSVEYHNVVPVYTSVGPAVQTIAAASPRLAGCCEFLSYCSEHVPSYSAEPFFFKIPLTPELRKELINKFPKDDLVERDFMLED